MFQTPRLAREQRGWARFEKAGLRVTWHGGHGNYAKAEKQVLRSLREHQDDCEVVTRYP
jgi:hypothetical protein